MASRNPYSSLNHRPAASSLFDSYPGNSNSNNEARSRPSSTPAQNSYTPYTSSPYDHSNGHLPNNNTTSNFRPASPNKKGQFSTSVLESLESQNDTTATTLLSQKVSQLKQLTVAIGEEIRDSSSLAQTLNDNFENTTVRLRGTMRRMLRMAEKTGVGWRIWAGFFAAVVMLFVYVWLF